MIDRWEIPKISVISAKVDRFAGILVAVGKISPIFYGIRPETEGLRVLVGLFPKFHRYPGCVLTAVWRSVKVK